jgi:hypothetical protein
VWTAEFDRDEKMAAVKVALDKNRWAGPALEAVGLDLAHLVLGKDSTTYKTYLALRRQFRVSAPEREHADGSE